MDGGHVDFGQAAGGDVAEVKGSGHVAVTCAEFCDQLPGGAENLPDGIVVDGPGDSISGDLLSAVRGFYDIALSWHREEPGSSSAPGGIAATVLHLHAMNFGLWHHEDAVRRPGISDHEVARRKRCIDDLNARRNAAIEDIDTTLLDRLNPSYNPGVMLHTETPGTIVDRLSVLALRILHTDGGEQCGRRLWLLEEQYGDLFSGLDQVLIVSWDGLPVVDRGRS
jgi:hypothetical protein